MYSTAVVEVTVNSGYRANLLVPQFRFLLSRNVNNAFCFVVLDKLYCNLYATCKFCES